MCQGHLFLIVLRVTEGVYTGEVVINNSCGGGGSLPTPTDRGHSPL